MPAEALAATFSLQLAFAPREQDVSHANTFQMSAGGSRVTGNPTGHCRGALRARGGGVCGRGRGEHLCSQGSDPEHGSSPPPAWDLLLSFSSALEAELNYGYFYVH